MSDEVTLIQAWIAQGQQTDDGGIPIPPRMEEAAIARVRKRLFGPGATPTGEPPEHYAVDELEDGAYQARMEPVPMDHMAYDQDPRGGCVAQCRAHRDAVLASAADEPTTTGEPTWALDPRGQVERLAEHMNDCDGADPELPAGDQAMGLLTNFRRMVLAMSASAREARARLAEVEAERERLYGQLVEASEATTEILASQTRAEAERDRWKAQAKVNGKAGAMAESERISAEARAEQAERDRERIREAWSEVTAGHNRIKATAGAISGDDYWGWLGDGDDDLETMSDGMQVRITAGCLRGVIEEAKAAPALPEGARDLMEIYARLDCLDWAEGTAAGFDCSETTACITEWCPPCALRAVLSRTAKDGAASKVRDPEPDTLYRADCRTGATPCLHGCHHGECHRAKDGKGA